MSTAAQSAHWSEAVLPESHMEEGSLGSKVLALRGGSPHMLKAMVEGLAIEFRKSWYDLAGGLAVFMAPSRAHEVTSEEVGDLVKALCHANGLAIVSLRSATARTGDRNRGLEPDESYLIGERAARFLRIKSEQGLEAALEDAGDDPPDLAVEVEHTEYDSGKIAIYRNLGVRELWELATGAARRAPRILDLQAPSGARPVEVSRILPGVQAERLPAAVAELGKIGGLMAFVAQMASGEPVARRLLNAARMLEPSSRQS